MTDELCDAIAEILYNAEKHKLMYHALSGEVMEWNALRDFQKAPWRQRTELAVKTYLDITRTRYEALTDADLASRTEEHTALLQAGEEWIG